MMAKRNNPKTHYPLVPWHGETVFLDTETTGLNPPYDKIVEIAIVDEHRNTLVNSLVNPQRDIPYQVTQIHGISTDMVEGSPTYEELEPEIIEALEEKRVVIYNKAFDWGFLALTTQDAIPLVECCMLRFATYYGQWNARYNNFKWQNLAKAAKHTKYQWEGASHRALADTLATQAVWQFLDEQEQVILEEN